MGTRKPAQVTTPANIITNPLVAHSALDLAAGLKSGHITSVELVRACLGQIEALEPELQAWAYLDPQLALEQAEKADAARHAGGALGPLHGLPVGVKDIIDTADMPTEYGTAIHRGRQPSADATIVARLRAAGATIMGKTVTSAHAVYTAGPTRNPHDLSRTPGSSSSGSAAAMAAHMVPLSLGTQTNGSIIRPASFCGVVGYKPSFGLLPRTGILHQSTMVDQAGVITRDLADAAFLAEVIIGHDSADEQSLASPPPALLSAALDTSKAPKLVLVGGPHWDRVGPEARAALERFTAELGMSVERLDLPPEFDEAATIHSIIMDAGIAESYRDDFASSRALMADVLIRIIEHGHSFSAVEFIDALAKREKLRAAFVAFMAPYDAILTPATLGIAPSRENGTGDPIMATIWTLLGAPALTLPLLTGAEGMPLGIQMVGGLLQDEKLLRAAAWLERFSARH